MAKDALIRVDRPLHRDGRAYYVRSVGHDGSFAVTLDKRLARRFTLTNARATIARLQSTHFQFSVCDAPEAVSLVAACERAGRSIASDLAEWGRQHAAAQEA